MLKCALRAKMCVKVSSWEAKTHTKVSSFLAKSNCPPGLQNTLNWPLEWKKTLTCCHCMDNTDSNEGMQESFYGFSFHVQYTLYGH